MCALSGAAAQPTGGREGRTRLRPVRAVTLLTLEQDLAQLVLLAGLENGEHLVSRLELRRRNRDLRAAVAHHRDQTRALRQIEPGNRPARARRVPVGLHSSAERRVGDGWAG